MALIIHTDLMNFGVSMSSSPWKNLAYFTSTAQQVLLAFPGWFARWEVSDGTNGVLKVLRLDLFKRAPNILV